GTNIPDENGLLLDSGANIIQRLIVQNFWDGIYVNASDNLIGTDGDGQHDADEGNVISGNRNFGILVHQANTIAGNRIGVNEAGDAAMPNASFGIYCDACDDSLIGTDGDGKSDTLERNIISGNGGEGIYISGTAGDIGPVIAGNYIGLNAAGNAAIPNQSDGINATTLSGIIIGTNGDGQGDEVEGNIISGNDARGILLQGPATGWMENARVAGNRIGVTADGAVALPNGDTGIDVGQNITGLVIGTNGDGVSDALEGNVISGNELNGVNASDFDGLVIAGNYIGLNAAGDAAIPNALAGVSISGQGARIGSNGDGVSDELERNVISGNTRDGIQIELGANLVAGNYIGLNAAGDAEIPNGVNGISLDSGGNIIGTNGDGQGDVAERNVISGNTTVGIAIHNTADANVVAGNYIGLNAAGDAAFDYDQQWIGIEIASAGNIIGTDGDGQGDAQEANVIAGNIQSGVHLSGSAADQNRIAGNTIGWNATRQIPIPNWQAGVALDGNMTGNTITRNHISDAPGIDLGDDGPTPNDAGDVDTGANDLQNYPLLNSAALLGNQLIVTGTLDTLPSRAYTLEFFGNYNCGYGGDTTGREYLGTAVVTTTASGSVDFVSTLAVGDVPLRYISATATDPDGNTSEFSACTMTAMGISVTDASVIEGDAESVNAVFTITLAAESATTVTVTWTTTDGTALVGEDYLRNYDTLVFVPGEITKTVPVAVPGDDDIEEDEIFYVILSNPVNAVLDDAQGVGTILTDDVLLFTYLPVVLRR
ncbi:MAG: hypothetical protein JW726_12805, partial [Anaerolineales bacterium]|nr:hypothetical protein [Anaerolineales bacterium]